MKNINNFRDDEYFLKIFLKDLYYKIIETNDFNNFEKSSNEWIKYILESNNKNSEKVLKIMENHKESKFWFTSFIGFFYQLGIGCDIDKEKALNLYFLSINNEIENDSSYNEDFNKLCLIEDFDYSFVSLRNKNIIIGKYLLSLFYYKDIILDINYKQNKLAMSLKLAKKGDLEAQYNLAICYMDGKGVRKDKKKALKWFLKSENKYFKIILNKNEREFKRILKLAIENDSTAQNNMGNFYKYGKGTDRNEKKAFEWYTKSAIAGCANGQYNLGVCYENGIGTAKDDNKAFEWYLKSAEAENEMAQNNLGIYYRHGKGTDKNEIKAFEWILKSATAGYPNGQYNLGFCYANEVGTDKNITKSFEWYLKSAESEFAVAQNYVGDCYNYGFGTNKDKDKAIYWYEKALDNGIKEVKDKLDNMHYPF
ncbi:HCP-like protein [Rhizophagus irregularis]|uniref:HCP-like protein n=1 Tax=Rhizophagus irregularis TaxID=588596 RepID=A0A2I1GD54_9GLOM|nr:HCP-like protein [Rhizophagus irregularis]